MAKQKKSYNGDKKATLRKLIIKYNFKLYYRNNWSIRKRNNKKMYDQILW